jgi:hypothetical protein
MIEPPDCPTAHTLRELSVCQLARDRPPTRMICRPTKFRDNHGRMCGTSEGVLGEHDYDHVVNLDCSPDLILDSASIHIMTI